MGIDQLKKEILEDYKNWIAEALHGKTDNVGIIAISIENMSIKLDKLIKVAKKEEI